MVNKLPGLTRNDDTFARSNASPAKGRVVTGYQGPNAPGLRPTASPVDMYARPERPAVDNRVQDLAEALGSLNPALMRFAETQKTQNDEMLPARLAQRYSGKSADEQLQMMKNDPDMQTTMGKANAKAEAEQTKKTILDEALAAGDQKELAWLKDSTYLDENGNEKTVTVQQKRDAAVNAMIEREQRWLQTAPGKSEEKAETSFNRTVAWLSENGAKHPQWEAQLTAGPSCDEAASAK